jgi:hypothetical protein
LKFSPKSSAFLFESQQIQTNPGFEIFLPDRFPRRPAFLFALSPVWRLELVRPRPRWAQIVLAPGLYTANWARDNLFPNVRDGSFRETVGVVVGLVTMGLVCGTLAALLSLGMGKGKGEPERT